MFGRKDRDRTLDAGAASYGDTGALTRDRVLRARGGVSLAAVLTGVVVSIGAFFLLSAIVGGVLSVTGVDADELTGADAGLPAGIALVAAFFLAYLWGGYTAGRMSRGSGFLNGLLVPVVALLVGAIVGGIVYALGTTAELNLPFSTNRLPLEDDNYVVDWTLGLGAAALIAMFLGGIAGGLFGSRWHTKLERSAVVEREEAIGRERRVDLREGSREDGPGFRDMGRGESPATTPPEVRRHPSSGPPPGNPGQVPPPPRTTPPPSQGSPPP